MDGSIKPAAALAAISYHLPDVMPGVLQPPEERVDWIGFDNCVRNAALIYTPPPPKITKKRAKRYTQSSAAGASSPSAFSRGERGN